MASQIKCCTFSSSPNRGGESTDHDAPSQSSCIASISGDNFDLWLDFAKYWESLINRFYVVLPALLEGLQGPQQRTCWEGTLATCHSCKNQRRLAVMTCMRVGAVLTMVNTQRRRGNYDNAGQPPMCHQPEQQTNWEISPAMHQDHINRSG
jgi:hypothetical protein